MSIQKQQLLALSATLCEHDNVTHWAISMRLFGKGDFFHRIRKSKRAGFDPLTFEAAMSKFSKIWPEDLEWPSDIPRPDAEEDAA